MRYSSLFSNHWQLGGNCQWLDASSTKKDHILICFIDCLFVKTKNKIAQSSPDKIK